MADLDQLDKEIISIIQAQFPLEANPYDVLGERFAISGDELFSRVQKMYDAKLIRRLGAVFDSYHLGYRSALCAISVPDEEKVQEVADFISAYPQVTHTYYRPNKYNIWFTLTCASELERKVIFEEIAKKTGYSDILYLPAIRLYKIQVNFNLTDSKEADLKAPDSYREPGKIVVEEFDELSKELVRQLHGNLIGQRQPFSFVAQEVKKKLADELGYEINETVVLQRMRNWKFNHTMRRFGALLRHQKVGFSHNGMVVWNVPDEIAITVGTIMALQPEVSHCYERVRYKQWPYNMYTMVHGSSEEEVEAVAQRIVEDCRAQGIDIAPEMILYSTNEFKKVSMKYFL